MSSYLLPHSVRFCKLIFLSCILRHFFVCKGVKEMRIHFPFFTCSQALHALLCIPATSSKFCYCTIPVSRVFIPNSSPFCVSFTHKFSCFGMCVELVISPRKRSFLSLTARMYSFSAYRSSVKRAMVW